jgi:hypothetical protein
MWRAMLAALLLGALGDAGADEKLFEGRYAWNDIRNTLQPCGSVQIYWLDASDDVQSKLRKFVKGHAAGRQQPVYVELRGQLGPAPRDGFGADYDGMLKVSDIVQMKGFVPAACR